MLLEFAKEQYFHEADRRDKLTSSTTIPIGAATIIITSASYSLEKISLPINVFHTTSFVFFIYLFVAMFYFFWEMSTFFGEYTYRYIGLYTEMRDHHQRLLAFYTQSGNVNSTARQVADQELENDLVNEYCECATHNALSNDNKSGHLHRMNGWLKHAIVAAFLFAFFSEVGKRYGVM